MIRPCLINMQRSSDRLQTMSAHFKVADAAERRLGLVSQSTYQPCCPVRAGALIITREARDC
ncbi:hypothetical protein ACDH50_06135 [Xanthomonas fragariae]|uniref:hypothetical protein n=1 Tax=Xanthomonas fragariae TaxID=48664 RepID=UPI001ABE000E